MQITFGGLDNQHDPQTVGPDGLVTCANIDHRDDKSITRRQGSTVSALTGAALHSLWGAEDGSHGYIADGTSLYHLDTSLTQTLVGTVPSGPIAYAEGTNATACITATETKFVSGTGFVTYPLPTTLDGETVMAAQATWGGTCGCFYNDRYFVAVGDILHYTLPGFGGIYDVRDYQLPIGFQILTTFAADDGIWVGGANKCIFLEGDDPDNFVFKKALSFGVLSGAPVDLKDWEMDGVDTTFAVCSTVGTLLLRSSGQVIDLSKGKYAPPTGSGHRSIFRQCNGYKQFLTCLTYGGEGIKYTPKSIPIDYAEA